MGSGPYRVAKVEPGRSVTYRRVTDYWARDLPVNRGRYNLDVIRYDYYRDRDVAMEAFKSGDYDFREEFTSKVWATGYNFPAIERGWVVRETLPDARPAGTQAFFLNVRLDKFAHPKVREAIGYAFDYEWLNKNMFHGQYGRTRSMFQNSPLAASGPPSTAESAVLEAYRDQLPAHAFTQEYNPPATDGSGNIRGQLRAAAKLLAEAGWEIKDGVLVGPDGAPLEIEFLIDEPTFERIIGPFIKNLEKLGIAARIRTVDSAQYQNRFEQFDYDVVVARFLMSMTPGVEQRNMWGSEAADLPGSYNLSGIKNPVVDALIEQAVAAPDRASLTTIVARARPGVDVEPLRRPAVVQSGAQHRLLGQVRAPGDEAEIRARLSRHLVVRSRQGQGPGGRAQRQQGVNRRYVRLHRPPTAAHHPDPVRDHGHQLRRRAGGAGRSG